MNRHFLQYFLFCASLVTTNEPAFADRGKSSDFAAKCMAPAGTRDLVIRSTVNWILLGELHGTREIPSEFFKMACAAVHESKRRIIVALEQPTIDQRAIDIYIQSKGDTSSKRRFLKSSMWQSEMKDGRSSIAYFDLFDALRKLRRHNSRLSLIAFAPRSLAGGVQDYESSMASSLQSMVKHKGDLVLALLGRFHARKDTTIRSGNVIRPAGNYLPSGQVISLNVVWNQGSAWNCTPQCGVHEFNMQRNGRRGIFLDASAGPASDGYLDLGVPISPSLPMTVQNVHEN